MPGMDGIETAMRIRARMDGQRITLIALTGWGQDSDRNETQAAGFALHLIKPVNLDHLEAVLDRLTKPYESRDRESACGSDRCSS
jgi:CheY-like chemotaxis protein